MRFIKDRRDFEHWWEKLSEADRRVYSVFCQQPQTSIDDLHSMMLSIPAEGGRNLIMNRPMIQDSLYTLKTMGLIRELEDLSDEVSFDTTYELAGQWHARWFRQINKSSSQSLY